MTITMIIITMTIGSSNNKKNGSLLMLFYWNYYNLTNQLKREKGFQSPMSSSQEDHTGNAKEGRGEEITIIW